MLASRFLAKLNNTSIAERHGNDNEQTYTKKYKHISKI